MSLRPAGEAGPAAGRRCHAAETARLSPAAGRGQGAVGEEPGAGAAAVPAHRPRQSRRFGEFSPNDAVVVLQPVVSFVSF